MTKNAHDKYMQDLITMQKKVHQPAHNYWAWWPSVWQRCLNAEKYYGQPGKQTISYLLTLVLIDSSCRELNKMERKTDVSWYEDTVSNSSSRP